MRRHLISGQFGPSDSDSTQSEAEVLSRLDFVGSNGRLRFGISQALDDLAKIGIFPSEIGVDLFLVAAHVQFADTHISRTTESQNSWTREIRLVVPVSDPEKWDAAAPVLERTLNFLTGDIWTLNFRPRPTGFSTLVPCRTLQLTPIPYDCLALFSGGLDSLIGAIDLLQNEKNPFLISHVGEGAISNAQDLCFNMLKSHYAKSYLDRLRVWLNFQGLRVSGSQMEKTTRGRSFLFFSMGILAGTGFRRPFTLNIPENGLIALNIPLDPLRLGSHSTRTTHPFYIARWNEILKILQIKGKIENPYWNKTKGEMVSECTEQTILRKLIPSSLSCSSPTKGRWLGHGTQHCGHCVPCIIRRAALERGLGSGADPTIYSLASLTQNVLNSRKAEGQQIRSFQYAIERLRVNPGLARFEIHKSGSLADESLIRQQELANVYSRGMSEVEHILTGVQTEPN